MSYDKTKQEQLRKETAETNFHYQRFLLLRYLLAIFFFANLYWALASFLSGGYLALMISVLLLVVCGFAVSEHVKLYGDKSDQVELKLYFNRYYHLFQTMVNACLFLIAVTDLGFNQMFPFLIDSFQTRLFIIGIVLLGSGLSWICLRRIHRISQKKDKQYQYIKDYKRSIS
ncbi:hypothetical protein [Tetragenococcus koreensis]|uniref:hypothetical protein n=1 Tax=Tetragenococcus koreensis TaxID=290335 RepID=UPI001F360AD1|nr:hypothetical protein [Tetragenococcus koreensis]MCF1617367.1 hypothetical protein [Tetragenococcus koreensis]MCF1622226.1 hypothetical protein [Tetragenococcus koreensis]MCF1628015.1 hypothetical protein [Tetragenococcus koreensis]MCF1678304.1 hypothetical protein [Tetragenococcus koreensis]MCF1680760.1 hypothetical protein [Tetragenococcus koreensis]